MAAILSGFLAFVVISIIGGGIHCGFDIFGWWFIIFSVAAVAGICSFLNERGEREDREREARYRETYTRSKES